MKRPRHQLLHQAQDISPDSSLQKPTGFARNTLRWLLLLASLASAPAAAAAGASSSKMPHLLRSLVLKVACS
jgi:hypothetical protein